MGPAPSDINSVCQLLILVLAEVNPVGYRELAAAKVLDGHDAWAPMALVGGRLLVRDLETMACLQVGLIQNAK